MPTESTYGTESLVKIWTHDSNTFWSVNSFLTWIFRIESLGQSLVQKKHKICIFKSLAGLILIKIGIIFHSWLFYIKTGEKIKNPYLWLGHRPWNPFPRGVWLITTATVELTSTKLQPSKDLIIRSCENFMRSYGTSNFVVLWIEYHLLIQLCP